MSARLTPGNYFIELAFRRPVDEATLSAALEEMGFSNIEFDKNEDPTVGAVSLYSSSVSSTLRSPTASVLKVAAAAPTISVKPASSAPAATISVKPASSTAVVFKAAAPAVPAATVSVKPSTSPTAVAIKAAVPSNSSISVKPASPTATVIKASAPADSISLPTKRGGSTPAPATAEGPASATASVPASAPAEEPVSSSYESYAAKDGGSGGGGGGAGTVNEYAEPNNHASSPHDYGGGAEASTSTVTPPTPVAPPVTSPVSAPDEVTDSGQALLKQLSSQMSQGMALPIVDRWKRWVEWGSPFATAAGHLVNVSGEEEKEITRFRFVASLNTSFAPTNLQDMSWVFIRRLSLNPFADLSFQLIPFKLQRGMYYEFRFFSRLKSNPTKESVKEAMTKMGFSPMKLNLLKKNMRIPHRARVSVNMWLGIGRWTAANSIITEEDPFFFEKLVPVKP